MNVQNLNSSFFFVLFKGHKEIFIHGAEILASTNLQSYEGVKTFPDCKNKCQKYGCKRLEYSRKEATCRITKSTKESFELMGNVQWSYYGKNQKNIIWNLLNNLKKNHYRD